MSNNKDNTNSEYRSKVINFFLSRQFNNSSKNKNNNTINNKPFRSQSRSKSKYKWTTFVHNGVKFPEEYEYKRIPILYGGKKIYLSKEAEELAILYAKYVDTEYSENNTFNRNFFNDWKKILGKDTEVQSLDKCDFSLMQEYLYNEKEKNKELRKQEKDKKTQIDEDEKYKTAIVDGKTQTISIYKIEPPGIFIGRGKNPNLGKIKKRIYPEDVTINIGKDSPIPSPPTGHKWGKVVHDRTVEWLASWKDSITGKTKYFWLSQQSDIKAGNDQKKYDFAKKLKKKIKLINDTNDENMSSSDIRTMQIATSLFFIDKLALRVGNEKADDGADTVGVTNLRVEHITLTDTNKITLDFLGKDSVPYTNTVQVSNIVFNNIKKLISGKDKYDQIFDQITSNDVNKYLQGFMKDLTAKVFRTYNASNVFQKELNKITKKSGDTQDSKKQIMDDFAKANAKVAKLLNHQKNISTGYKKSVDKINELILNTKKKLNQARRKKTKNPSTIDKLKNKIKNYKSKKELLKEMKNVSLGTSKANYVDPRITVAFLKKHDLDVNKIFPKTLQNKFAWAFQVDENYKF